MKINSRTNEIKEKQETDFLSCFEKVEAKEYKTSSLIYSRDVYVKHVHGERWGKNQLDETSHSSQPIR